MCIDFNDNQEKSVNSLQSVSNTQAKEIDRSLETYDLAYKSVNSNELDDPGESHKKDIMDKGGISPPPPPPQKRKKQES